MQFVIYIQATGWT